MDERPAAGERGADVPVTALSEGVAAVAADGRLEPRNEPMRRLLKALAVERLAELPLTAEAAVRLAAGETEIVVADLGPHLVRLVRDGASGWLLATAAPVARPPLGEVLQWRRAQTLGNLAGALVHDLANLLLSGIGVAEAVRPLVSDESEADAIAEMEQGARKGALLCRALARQLRIAPRAWEVIELAAVAEEALAIVRKESAHHGVEVRSTVVGGDMIRVVVAEAVQAVVQAVLCCIGGGAAMVEVQVGASASRADGRGRRLACLRVAGSGVPEPVVERARRALAGWGPGMLGATPAGDSSGLLLAAFAVARAGGELTVAGEDNELRLAFAWPDVSRRGARSGRCVPPPTAT